MSVHFMIDLLHGINISHYSDGTIFLKLFLLYSVLKTPLTLVTQGEKCGSVSCSVLGCPGLAKTVMLQFSQNL